MDKNVFKGAILALVAIAVGVLVLAVAFDESENNTSTTSATTTSAIASTATTLAPVVNAKDPSLVTVIVVNGTDVEGAAGAITKILDVANYNTLDATDASKKPQPSSKIFYHQEWRAEAQEVAKALSVPSAEIDQTIAVLPTAFDIAEIETAVVVVVLGETGSLAPQATTTTTTTTTTT